MFERLRSIYRRLDAGRVVILISAAIPLLLSLTAVVAWLDPWLELQRLSNAPDYSSQAAFPVGRLISLSGRVTPHPSGYEYAVAYETRRATPVLTGTWIKRVPASATARRSVWVVVSRGVIAFEIDLAQGRIHTAAAPRARLYGMPLANSIPGNDGGPDAGATATYGIETGDRVTVLGRFRQDGAFRPVAIFGGSREVFMSSLGREVRRSMQAAIIGAGALPLGAFILYLVGERLLGKPEIGG